MLTLCDLMDYSPPGSSVHGISPGRNSRVGGHFLLQGSLPDPGMEPLSPALQLGSLTLSHQGNLYVLFSIVSLSLFF